VKSNGRILMIKTFFHLILLICYGNWNILNIVLNILCTKQFPRLNCFIFATKLIVSSLNVF